MVRQLLNIDHCLVMIYVLANDICLKLIQRFIAQTFANKSSYRTNYPNVTIAICEWFILSHRVMER